MSTTEKAWSKITGSDSLKLGPQAIIPLYDGEGWMYVRNIGTSTRPEQAENLRRTVAVLMDHFPETVPQLERLGVRVKALIKRPITTPQQAEAWGESIFNTGPTSAQLTPKPTRGNTQRSVASEANGAVSAPVRPRGRPRKDGLVPGSPEAKEADAAKQAALHSERAAKLKAKGYSAVIPPDEYFTVDTLPTMVPEDVMPPPRRRLVRVGQPA